MNVQHTHNLQQWAIVNGRKAQCFVRPPKTTQKSQREPVVSKPITFPTKADALAFKQRFDA